MSNTGQSNFLQNRLINYLLRNYSFSPCPIWIALYTTPTTASGLENDTDVFEVSASCGYQRTAASGIYPDPKGPRIPWNVTNGTGTNNYQIDFPTSTSEWGTVNYVGIRTGSTGTSGSLYFYGPLSTPTQVPVATIFSLVQSSFYISLGAFDTDNSCSYYLANGLLNYILNGTTFTPPGLSVYLGLFTKMPLLDGTGGAEINPTSSSSGYMRQLLGGTYGWATPVSGSTVNLLGLSFTASAPAEWGTIAGLGIFNTADTSKSASGTLLFLKPFNQPKKMIAGDGLRFDAGYLKISMD